MDPSDLNISLRRQCELLGINRSSYYYAPSPLKLETVELMHKIDKLYTEFPYYGYPRITAQLRREGIIVNEKKIARLMKIMGIQAIYPKKSLSKNNTPHPVYPYLLNNLNIICPNQVWGTDITYIKAAKIWFYLVAIMDWFSRYVLAWKLSPNLSGDFCAETLRQALKINIPGIHNSDQGCQFTAEDYLAILKQKTQIRISMDGRGRCFDNIFTERLWRTVKYEEVYLKDYQSFTEAEKSLNQYFKTYNHKRLHQSLNYRTPAEVYFSNN